MPISRQSRIRKEDIIEKARSIVNKSSIAAGGVGLVPIPFSDALAIAPIQANMIAQICSAFRIDSEKTSITSLVTGLAGITAVAYAGRAAVSGVLKFIPFVGSAAGCAVATVITKAIGEAWIHTLASFWDENEKRAVLPVNLEKVWEEFKAWWKN